MNLPARHAFRWHVPALGRDAELRVCGAIAGIATTTLDNFEKEAFAINRSVKLKIFAILDPVIKDVFRFEPVEQGAFESQAGVKIVIVVPRDRER